MISSIKKVYSIRLKVIYKNAQDIFLAQYNNLLQWEGKDLTNQNIKLAAKNSDPR